MIKFGLNLGQLQQFQPNYNIIKETLSSNLFTYLCKILFILEYFLHNVNVNSWIINIIRSYN